jgi:hypothetical protein
MKVRATRDRWDVQAGTFAVVDTVGHAGQFGEWCFTVRWQLPPQSKRAMRRDYSLNLFEGELADFELFNGPLPSISSPQRRRTHAIIPESLSPQLSLPYTTDDFISDRLDLDPFALTVGPLRDLDLDL